VGIHQVDLIRAVFLDRDGVLNRNVLNPETGEFESPGKASDLELFPWVLQSLLLLQDAGYLLFLVSNQPNYAKGKSTLDELHGVHAALTKSLGDAGRTCAQFFFCFHHPQGIVPSHSGICECRKPSPYFLQKAASDFGVSLSHSWMVGDRASDIQCGNSVGVRTIRVLEDHPAKRAEAEPVATLEASDLSHAVSLILATDSDHPAS
jgi:D-glycero-D-manno-heptose 1,7-bisphosphate phosphatase